MARPIKDNADYFSHDADMRDDPKIKALRRKFKAEGFGIWCMLLEAITDSDNFRLGIDLEILAGDFDISPELLDEIISYCIKLGLLQTDEERTILWSKTLDNRFEPLLSKRERDRRVVIASENAHSKVKESKEKKEIEVLLPQIALLLQRKSQNTMEVRSMVQQWVNEGHTDIIAQLQAMKVCYQKQGLVFPSRIPTLTQSFVETDWIEKLKDLDPERIAERIQLNGIKKQPEPDTIGVSKPGSLG